MYTTNRHVYFPPPAISRYTRAVGRRCCALSAVNSNPDSRSELLAGGFGVPQDHKAALMQCVGDGAAVAAIPEVSAMLAAVVSPMLALAFQSVRELGSQFFDA